MRCRLYHPPSVRRAARWARRGAETCLLLVLGACGSSPVAVDGSCVAVVNVGGTFFSPTSLPRIAPGEVEGVHTVVTVGTGCLDQGEAAVELVPGTSNFLEAGTRIHRVSGYEASELLTYWSDVVSEWLALAPSPTA